MYIKTPKRYRGVQRRSYFSCQRFLLIVILLALIVLGIGFYQNRRMYQPQISEAVSGVVVAVQDWAGTQTAPTPTPTPDPSRNLASGNEAWQRGSISDALTYYLAVLPSRPNDVNLYSRVTTAYLTRGDGENAIAFAERTVTADPFSAESWAIRSFALSWEGRYQMAIASAEQALAIAPDDPVATAFLAYAYYGAQQYQRALDTASAAIRANPDRFEAYWVRALIYEASLFDWESALKDFEVAYLLAPEQNPAMTGVAAAGIARILVRPEYGEFDRAVSVLTDALRLDIQNTTALYHLGWVQYTYRGDYAQAQNPLQTCAETEPDNVRCLFLLGRTRVQLGDSAGALDAFVRAIEQGTPYARHYWWAAEIERTQLGDCAAAAEYLQTGYRMVVPGDLSAIDEGDTTLIADFENRMNLCGVPFSPQPEATAEISG
jgi:tetratricopeptide (TPR) repeat protein